MHLAAALAAFLVAAGCQEAPRSRPAPDQALLDVASRVPPQEALQGDLWDLCDLVGGRVTGSAASGQAIDWATRRSGRRDCPR